MLFDDNFTAFDEMDSLDQLLISQELGPLVWVVLGHYQLPITKWT